MSANDRIESFISEELAEHRASRVKPNGREGVRPIWAFVVILGLAGLLLLTLALVSTCRSCMRWDELGMRGRLLPEPPPIELLEWVQG